MNLTIILPFYVDLFSNNTTINGYLNEKYKAWEDVMTLGFKHKMSVAMLALGLSGMANLALAEECRVSQASMDRPNGFPDRALTMIVPYGPGGGSGQVAAAMAEAVTE